MSGKPITGDGARADDPALDELLQEARRLHPQAIDLSLDRLRGLLAKLDNPHLSLPPVLHIAGTNGKGSVTAFLRACLEAAGLSVHVYTSPHLVRFNERIRLAGTLIDDAALTQLLGEVMEANAGDPITFFELTTAAAFKAFAETPADALVLEVGLGGRFDATNVIEDALVCGLTHISRDHERFLGTDIVKIAGEKAGIAKPGVPLVTARYPAAMAHRIAHVAADAGAVLMPRGTSWDATFYKGRLHYRDEGGKLSVSPPRLPGAHQHDNAALAVAMLRHQQALPLPDSAIRAGIGWASWPARLQTLDSGPLAALLPNGAELYLDGGHNPAAGRILADFLRRKNKEQGRPIHIVAGMVTGKKAARFLKPLAARAASLYAVPVPHHEHQEPQALVAAAAEVGLPGQASENVSAALTAIARAADPDRPPLVLVCGSLYLAGEVLRESGLIPA